MWNNFARLLKRGPVSWHMHVHWRHVGLLWKSVATSWWLTGTAGWDGVWRGVCCVCFCSFFLFRFRSSRHQRERARRSGVNWCGGFTLVTSRDASKQTDVSGRNACRTLRGACNNVWALCCELYDSGSRSRGRKVPRYRQRNLCPSTTTTPADTPLKWPWCPARPRRRRALPNRVDHFRWAFCPGPRCVTQRGQKQMGAILETA